MRKNNPAALRARLIDTAYGAFVRDGYDRTSMHDLKQEAGVSGGALAHHFPTKKDIGLSVLGDRVTRAIEETWIEPLNSASTVRKGVAAILLKIAAELSSREFVTGCPLNNLAHDMARKDPEFRMVIDAMFQRWREAIATKIREGGVDGNANPESMAVLIVAAYSGAMGMAKASQRAEPLELCARQLDAILSQAGID